MAALSVTLTAPATATRGTPGSGATDAPRAPLAWGPAETVTTFASPDSESLRYPNPIGVADAAGTVTALWDAAGPQAAQRDPAGHWGSPVALDPCPSALPSCLVNRAIVVDGTGIVTAVWDAWDTASNRVYVAALRPGGAWSSPTLLATQSGTAGYLALAAAGNDRAVLAFSTGTDRHPKVVAFYKSSGVAWSAADRRTFREAQHPSVGISDGGVAVLVVSPGWTRKPLMRSYRYRPTAGWGPARRLGLSIHNDRPPYAVATSPRGRTVLAYLHDARSNPQTVGSPTVRVRVMDRHGSWGRARLLSRPGGASSELLQVVSGPAAAVAWSSAKAAIRVAMKSPGHRWKVSTPYPRGSGTVWQLDRNARGDLLVLWGHWSSSGSSFSVGRYTAGSGWSQPLGGPVQLDEMFAFGCVATLPDGTGLLFSNGQSPTGFAVLANVAGPAS